MIKTRDRLLFVSAVIILISIIFSSVILVISLKEGIKCNKNISNIESQLLNLQLIDEK